MAAEQRLRFTFNFWRTANLDVATGWGLHWDGMWSLAVEEQFYVAFPLLVLLAKTRRRLVLALSTIILLSVIYHLARLQSVSPYDSILGFQLIASGMLAAMVSPAIPSRRRGRLALYGGLLLGAGFLAPIGSLLLLLKQESIAGGASLLLCCVVSAPDERQSPLLRPIARIGELSYGLYLLHPLVLYVLGPALSGFGTAMGYVCFVLATAGLAELSSRFYEQPAERFVRSWLIKPDISVRRGPEAWIATPE
jgi:peptidoglycan/LPS O-acetylase OafA/YrhL